MICLIHHIYLHRLLRVRIRIACHFLKMQICSNLYTRQYEIVSIQVAKPTSILLYFTIFTYFSLGIPTHFATWYSQSAYVKLTFLSMTSIAAFPICTEEVLPLAIRNISSGTFEPDGSFDTPHTYTNYYYAYEYVSLAIFNTKICSNSAYEYVSPAIF